jgi:hypothetical protein
MSWASRGVAGYENIGRLANCRVVDLFAEEGPAVLAASGIRVLCAGAATTPNRKATQLEAGGVTTSDEENL